MKKTIGNYVYEKAKFLRTTCKYCGKTLGRGQIISGFAWCNGKCKRKWIRKHNVKGAKKYKDEPSRFFGVGFDIEGNSIDDNPIC